MLILKFVLHQTKTNDNWLPDPFMNVKPEEICSESKVDQNFSCQKCDKNLSSSKSLRRHMKTCHKDVDEKKVFHEQQVEEKSIIKCKECKVVFVTQDEYQKHKLVHKQSFECDVCQKVFLTRFRLKVNISNFSLLKVDFK